MYSKVNLFEEAQHMVTKYKDPVKRFDVYTKYLIASYMDEMNELIRQTNKLQAKIHDAQMQRLDKELPMYFRTGAKDG